jgi:hypothetical protein
MPIELYHAFDVDTVSKNKLKPKVVAASNGKELHIKIGTLKEVLRPTDARQFRSSVYKSQAIYTKVTNDPTTNQYSLTLSHIPVEGFNFARLKSNELSISPNVHVPKGEYVTTGIVILGKFIFINLLYGRKSSNHEKTNFR